MLVTPLLTFSSAGTCLTSKSTTMKPQINSVRPSYNHQLLALTMLSLFSTTALSLDIAYSRSDTVKPPANHISLVFRKPYQIAWVFYPRIIVSESAQSEGHQALTSFPTQVFKKIGRNSTEMSSMPTPLVTPVGDIKINTGSSGNSGKRRRRIHFAPTPELMAPAIRLLLR